MKACSLSFALAMRASRASTMSREENFFAARPAESSLSVRSCRLVMATGCLIGCPAARQIERRTGGKSAKVRCKPGDHLGHFLDLAEAVHRDLAQHVLDVLLGHLAEQLRLDHGRRHAV